ncbi:MAG TPA: glycosyltransferase [Spirochaetia bacterium]|nr:glycosyltransferase [Spirochaetia bacterium]
MKVALVYDRVNKFGGAERVLLTLHNIFPEAPLFTLVYDSKSASWAKVFKIIPTFINKIPFMRSKHELLAPIAALGFETLDLSGYDVVISITSSDAKAVLTKPGQLHICYCLTPTRYFWSGEKQYAQDIKFKIIPNWLHQYFRTTDLLISKRPDQYIAISNEVKRRIKKYYHRESSVIYPSIDDKFYSKEFTQLNKRDYYLIVSRLVPYKKVDLAIRSFNKIKKTLLVVGTGSEENNLKKIAGKTIEFVGAVDDNQLVSLYKNAKAVIFPQMEDYGLVPIESQACGTPVIAFGKGGALETIIENKTGVFFDEQTVESLVKAINKFEKLSINSQDCHKNSLRFNNQAFKKSFLNYFTNATAKISSTN